MSEQEVRMWWLLAAVVGLVIIAVLRGWGNDE